MGDNQSAEKCEKSAEKCESTYHSHLAGDDQTTPQEQSSRSRRNVLPQELLLVVASYSHRMEQIQIAHLLQSDTRHALRIVSDLNQSEIRKLRAKTECFTNRLENEFKLFFSFNILLMNEEAPHKGNSGKEKEPIDQLSHFYPFREHNHNVIYHFLREKVWPQRQRFVNSVGFLINIDMADFDKFLMHFTDRDVVENEAHHDAAKGFKWKQKFAFRFKRLERIKDTESAISWRHENDSYLRHIIDHMMNHCDDSNRYTDYYHVIDQEANEALQVLIGCPLVQHCTAYVMDVKTDYKWTDYWAQPQHVKRIWRHSFVCFVDPMESRLFVLTMHNIQYVESRKSLKEFVRGKLSIGAAGES